MTDRAKCVEVDNPDTCINLNEIFFRGCSKYCRYHPDSIVNVEMEEWLKKKFIDEYCITPHLDEQKLIVALDTLIESILEERIPPLEEIFGRAQNASLTELTKRDRKFIHFTYWKLREHMRGGK